MDQGMEQQKEQKYLATIKKASDRIKTLLAEIDQLKHTGPIAIIGMGCRFPGGADTPSLFWQTLCNAQDSVTLIPEGRWPRDLYYHPVPETPGTSYARHGGFIDQVDQFDHAFFNIPPAEALALDPQHRLLLEVSQQAIEDAGLDTDRLKGSRTGVFIGLSTRDYLQAHLESGDHQRIDAHSLTGTAFSTAVGRISYYYDFKGPSLAIDTACSSSLVALHLAVQSLRKQESDLSLVGGVNLLLTPEPFIGFSQLRALSPDGQCRTFDDAANGYVRGEGCGVVVLKRLSDAQRDRDPILAVIRGSAVNQDGESNGLTAPNALSQKQVIQNALADAGVAPQEVDYIECHGTGTALGDPLEARALGMVFSQRQTPLKIGSVKSSIGHLEAAAGMAGLIKAVLSVSHRSIPASLHFKTPSRHIPWHELPLEVVDHQTPWPSQAAKATAGISAFGFSGTNAHVIIESATNGHPESSSAIVDETPVPWHLLPISAASEAALETLIRSYIAYLRETGLAFKDICYSAAVSRKHYQHRLAVVAGNALDAQQALGNYLSGHPITSAIIFNHQTVLPSNDQPLSSQTALIDLGRQYGEGHDLDWGQIYADPVFQKVSLPHHPFLKRSFWLDPVHRPLKDPNEAPVLAQTIHQQIDGLKDALPRETPGAGQNTLEWTINQQLLLMSKQLELVGGIPSKQPIKSSFTGAQAPPSNQPRRERSSTTRTNLPPDSDTAAPRANVDIRSMTLFNDSLTDHQQQFVEAFIARYTKKTASSKASMQTHRPWFSDWINSLGFRLTLKEIIYPIVCNQAQGSRLIDIDGNHYLDMAIGYGVNYFGNNAPFVVEAVSQQIKKGFQLGPQFDVTGEVAQRITQLTGVERVTFSNTGTEAVMVALRIARTITGRDKIVIFKDSYHGIFDGILAANSPSGTIPMSPGTTPKTVDDVLVLTYGDMNSLDIITRNAREIAAVLVEPVQSRNPSLVPRDFLKALRELTFKHKIALIFDEIITGFRLCPGGAQAFYNIQADIVTYGKVIGGGLPISVIAGKARYLDAIDGGTWQFGDDSVPGKAVTFFGGTFCKHPLAIVAARAVLEHIQTQGPQLQEAVNRLTKQFADHINTWFAETDMPIRVRFCASFFRFESVGQFDARIQPLILDLLFYLMLEKGVYTWERRICFFSTTHRQEDVHTLITSIKQSIRDIQQGGFEFGAPLPPQS